MKRHLIGVFFFLFGLSFQVYSQVPLIKNGTLDLRNSNIIDSNIITLKGEWDLILDEFVNVDGIDENTFSIREQCPGVWNGANWKGEIFDGMGHGTYFLKILVNEGTKDLAIKILDIGLAYRLYVNDTFIGQGGVPGERIEEESPAFRPMVYSIPNEAYSSEIYIIVHISNYHHQNGGMWSPISIGNELVLRAKTLKKMSFELLVLGSILAIGFYHLTLFLIRKKEKFSLYLFLICMTLFFNYLSIEEMYIHNVIPDLDWLVNRKIGYITLYLVAPLNILFINQIFPNESIKILNKIYLYPTIIVIIITLFLNFPNANFFVESYQYITILSGIVLFYIVFKAVKHKRQSAWFFLVGVSMAYLTIVNDILYSLFIIDTVRLAHVGVLVYIATLSYVVTRKYDHAITEVEILSDELKEINSHLEEKVLQRTKDLERQKDIIENKNIEISLKHNRLLHLNEEQKNLMAIVAHDLRSPLNKILGLANILGHSLEKDENYEINQTILSIAEEGRKLITDITNLSEIESNDFQLNPSSCDVGDFLFRKINEFDSLAAEKSIKFKTEIDKNVITKVDVDFFGRIIDNLISNALKFSSFEKTVWVKLQKDNTHFIVSVKDEGPGFNPDDLKKIYRKFQKLSAKPTKGETSSGLGLSIVKLLLEKMGGKIDLETTQNEGSEFKVTLPLV